MAPKLEIRNLVKAYEGKVVLSEVALEVQPHEVICLIRPSY